jgi:hypothetical protein
MKKPKGENPRGLLRRSFAAVTAAFAVSLAPAAPVAIETGAADMHDAPPPAAAGLWKPDSLNTVVAVERCPDAPAKPCVSLYWIDPQDKRIFDYFGDPNLLSRDNFAEDEFSSFRRTPSEADVAALCGYSPPFTVAAVDERH